MGAYSLRTRMDMEVEVKRITFDMADSYSPEPLRGWDTKTHRATVYATVKLKNFGFESYKDTELTVDLPVDAEVCAILEEQILSRLGEVMESFPKKK